MGTVAIVQQRYGDLIPKATIESVIRAIADRFAPEKIILFGSYASATATPDSDLDLLLIMDTDLPYYKRATPVRLLFKPSPCAMDILVYTSEEVRRWLGTPNHIITEALTQGKIVYERSDPRIG